MTRKEVLQNQLDLSNSVLSNGVIVGLIGIAVYNIQETFSTIGIIRLLLFTLGFGTIGILCVKKRKKFLEELEKLN